MGNNTESGQTKVMRVVQSVAPDTGSKVLLGIIGALAPFGIMALIIMYGDIGKAQEHQEGSEMIAAIEHQRLADSVASHASLDAHPEAAKQIRKLENMGMRTLWMVERMYTKETGEKPPTLSEAFGGT